MMCKIKSLLPLCSLLLMLSACSGDPEPHQLVPVEQPFILYADQTVDSVRFYTFDSWSVVPSVDWITVVGQSQATIDYDYTKRYLFRVVLNITPNTSGETRSGTVLVKSYDYSYSSPIVQLGMLEVQRPAYTADSYLDDYGIIPKTAHYELVDSAHWTSDSICFKVENGWELLFDGTTPDWLQLDKTTDRKGRHRVNLTLTPNTNPAEEREAKLVLKSSGISTPITVRQLAPKKEE